MPIFSMSPSNGRLPQGRRGAADRPHRCRSLKDSTGFITLDHHEVTKTLVEQLVIVAVVIFLFLGSFRAVTVPLVSMPLSLIGAFFIMQMLGYSINLLTLLAMVLAIGLCRRRRHHRRRKRRPPHGRGRQVTDEQDAWRASSAARIIAMVIVLVAVYLPIGFQGGPDRRAVRRVWFHPGRRVAVSGVVALTLSPMMCSASSVRRRTSGWMARQHVDAIFERVRHGYARCWEPAVDLFRADRDGSDPDRPLGRHVHDVESELAPSEDEGIVVGLMNGPPTATATQMQSYAKQAFTISKSVPEYDQMFQITGIPTGGGPAVASGIAGVLQKPHDQRSRGAAGDPVGPAGEVVQDRRRLDGVPVPPLPGASACRCSSSSPPRSPLAA